MTFMTTAILLASLAAPGTPPAVTQDADDGERLAALAEDIEIMRRMLSGSLRGAASAESVAALNELAAGSEAAQEKADPREAATILMGAFGRGQKPVRPVRTRGFYVPGMGVFFTVETTVKTTLVKAKRSPEAEADDAWARMKKEVRTGGTQKTAGEERRAKLSDEECDQIARTLTKQILCHGWRLRGVDRKEHVIVTLFLKPASPQGVENPFTNLLAAHSAAMSAPPRRIVLSFECGRLVRDAEQGIDLDAAVQEAFVVRY